ncbi:Interferon-related developmental regulator 1 [Nymphaea thermarum]|nr:Interferon-related developmental regulator 1 [Nymphaea thermarum]
MARGKSQRKAAAFPASDEEILSTVSTIDSSELSLALEVDEVCSEMADLDNYLDALYEKRLSVREAGLNGLCKTLATGVHNDFATNKGETLLHQCVSILKRGSASETGLAARVLGLLVITAGEGKVASMVYSESSAHLSRIAKQSSNVTSRVWALKSLSIMTFIVGGDEDTDSTLTVLWQVGSYDKISHAHEASGITEPNYEVRAAALTSWAFLLTTATADQIDLFCLEGFPALLHLLEMEDRSVRLAAGEGVVAIVDRANRNASYPDHNSVNMFTGYEDVINQMKSLSIEAGGRGTSKKELGNQRSFFYDTLAYVQDGIAPDVIVKLSNCDCLKVNSWTRTIQGNPFLYDVFDFKPKQSKKQVLSTKEKVGNYGHFSVGMGDD